MDYLTLLRNFELAFFVPTEDPHCEIPNGYETRPNRRHPVHLEHTSRSLETTQKKIPQDHQTARMGVRCAAHRPDFARFLSVPFFHALRWLAGLSGSTGNRSVTSPAPPYRLVPVTVSCNGANSLASLSTSATPHTTWYLEGDYFGPHASRRRESSGAAIRAT